MSDTENQAVDILLPGARVCVFSTDSETLETAKKLQDDWHFGRVQLDMVDGDVETAIKTFQEDGSSDLIILQTDNIDDSFTERLGVLSGFCDEGTAAIIIGPVNDVYLYRHLIEMGVSDYLVRPVKPEILTEVISKALIERLGVSDSRLIVFVGAKGGVGTSSIAQICSYIVSEKMGHKALLMDAAGGSSSLSVGMGFDPSTTLFEAFRAVEANSEDALDRMFCDLGGGLSVLASGADAMLDPSLSAQQYETLLDSFLVKSPVVLVDLSAAESAIKKAVLARAHHIVMVSTPAVTSLRFCRSFLQEISEVRGGESSDISLVVNQSGLSKAHEVAASDIAAALEFKPSVFLSHLPSLFLKYESDMKQVLSDKGSDDLITAFLPILEKTLSGNVQGGDASADTNAGILDNFLGKFTAK